MRLGYDCQVNWMVLEGDQVNWGVCIGRWPSKLVRLGCKAETEALGWHFEGVCSCGSSCETYGYNTALIVAGV